MSSILHEHYTFQKTCLGGMKILFMKQCVNVKAKAKRYQGVGAGEFNAAEWNLEYFIGEALLNVRMQEFALGNY